MTCPSRERPFCFLENHGEERISRLRGITVLWNATPLFLLDTFRTPRISSDLSICCSILSNSVSALFVLIFLLVYGFSFLTSDRFCFSIKTSHCESTKPLLALKSHIVSKRLPTGVVLWNAIPHHPLANLAAHIHDVGMSRHSSQYWDEVLRNTIFEGILWNSKTGWSSCMVPLKSGLPGNSYTNREF